MLQDYRAFCYFFLRNNLLLRIIQSNELFKWFLINVEFSIAEFCQLQVRIKYFANSMKCYHKRCSWVNNDDGQISHLVLKMREISTRINEHNTYRWIVVTWKCIDLCSIHRSDSKTKQNESYLNVQNTIVYIEWAASARHPSCLWTDFLFHEDETKEAANEIRDINSHITAMYHAKIDVVLFWWWIFHWK